MIAKTSSATIVGVDAVVVDVEVQLFGSLRKFIVIGLPDGILRESRERIRCAIENSGFRFPELEVILSLAPASLPKSGAGLDLPMALAVLAAAGELDQKRLGECLILGELALNGTARPVSGVLATALLAKRLGRKLIIPQANAGVAAAISGVKVHPVNSLGEAVMYFRGELEIPPVKAAASRTAANISELGLGDVIGQHAAKRALEIAAAGGHNLLLIGPPGAGKSMLASCLPTLLPELTTEESVEVTKIYNSLPLVAGASSSAGGETARLDDKLLRHPPFRSPHHTVSAAGLIGGGSHPLPGEISLAHRGVLFLDELVEFRRDVLEGLRQPLEERRVVISRAKLRLSFPADFILVTAMNPCPCGFRGATGSSTTDSTGKRCSCSPQLIRRYLSRLSGPILDRIDLQVWLPPLQTAELSAASVEDPTESIRARVLNARKVQAGRFGVGGREGVGLLNSRQSQRQVKKLFTLGTDQRRFLESAANRLGLTARGYMRTLKTARTIADLEQSDGILTNHLAEALSYRIPDKHLSAG